MFSDSSCLSLMVRVYVETVNEIKQTIGQLPVYLSDKYLPKKYVIYCRLRQINKTKYTAPEVYGRIYSVFEKEVRSDVLLKC